MDNLIISGQDKPSSFVINDAKGIFMLRVTLIAIVCFIFVFGCTPTQMLEPSPAPSPAKQRTRLLGPATMTSEQKKRADELSNNLYQRMQKFVYVFNAVEEPNQSVSLPSTLLGVPDTSIANVYMDRSGLYVANTELKWTNNNRGGGLVFEVQLIHHGNTWRPRRVRAIDAWIGSTKLPLNNGAPNQERQIKGHLERFFEE